MFNRPSFRGVALLSVLALAIGGVSAAAAQAAPVNLITTATSLTGTGTVATQIAGPANFVTVNNTVVSGPGALPVYFTLSGGTTTTATTTGTIPAGGSVQVATPTVGTIVLLGYSITNGAAASSATDTITITVVTSLPGTVYATSTILGAPSTGLPTPATEAAFSVTQPSGAANVANFTVAELDAGGNAILPTNAKAIAVVVNNGLISSPNLAASPSPNTTFLTGTPISSVTDFVLSGINGLGGVATVNISVNGVQLKMYKVTFTGQAVTLTLTAINPVVGIGNAVTIFPTSLSPLGITANTNALKVQEFDALGNILSITPGNITITSSTPTIATAGSSDTVGNYPLGGVTGGATTTYKVMGVSINGVAAGTTNFTATDTALNLTSPPAAIRVSSGVATSVVLTTNLPTYTLGQLGTLTTTLSNAGGTLPAGTYVVLAGQAMSSIFLASGTAQLPGIPVASNGPPMQKVGQVTINNLGAYVSTFNAPTNSGNISISATPANSSIVVTPATFIVGTPASGGIGGTGGVTGSDVATPVSLAEASDASSAATDALVSITSAADSADAAAVTAATNVNAVQAVIAAQSSAVIKLLLASAALAAKNAALAAKFKH